MNGTVFGSASVTVVPAALHHIVVTPSPVNVIVNGALQFTATGYDSYNNPITGLTFTWTTNVGSVDSTGYFTAQATPLFGTVTATIASISGIANVNVVNAVIHHIVVVPGTAIVAAGGTLSFTAIAYDALDNVISGVLFVWTADVGTVLPNGQFTAQMAAGAGTVTATNGTVSGSAAVTVASHSFDIGLVIGWNLISTPLVPADPSIPAVFGSIAGQWDRLMWYNGSDAADQWKQYYTSWPAQFNEITSINCRIGFWLHALAATTLTVYGELPSNTSISMVAGWNMVGFPANDDRVYTVAQLKADTGADIVEGFDASAEYMTRVLEDSYVLKRGEGYWVHVNADSQWVIVNGRAGSPDELQGSLPGDGASALAIAPEDAGGAPDAATKVRDTRSSGSELAKGVSSGTFIFLAIAFLLVALRRRLGTRKH